MTAISANKCELPVDVKIGDFERRSVELGEYTVTFDSSPAGFPPRRTGTFDACQSPLENRKAERGSVGLPYEPFINIR